MGFSFEICRNWGWSSSEAVEAHGGLAQSLRVCVETFGVGFQGWILAGIKTCTFQTLLGLDQAGKDTQSWCCHFLWILCCRKGGPSSPGFSMFSQTEPPDLQADQAQLCRVFSASSAWPFLHSGPGMPSRDLLGVQDPAQCPFTGTRVAQVPHEEQNLQTRGLFYI